MSLTALERETIVTMNDGEEIASIWTAQRPVITKLKKNPAAVLVEEGNHDGSVWARFELPRGLVSFRTVRQTRTMSEEQRKATAERLAGARASKASALDNPAQESSSPAARPGSVSNRVVTAQMDDRRS